MPIKHPFITLYCCLTRRFVCRLHTWHVQSVRLTLSRNNLRNKTTVIAELGLVPVTTTAGAFAYLEHDKLISIGKTITLNLLILINGMIIRKIITIHSDNFVWIMLRFNHPAVVY